jgi:hypothetical protein
MVKKQQFGEVPPFVQIVHSGNILYGLDKDGRVWYTIFTHAYVEAFWQRVPLTCDANGLP